MVTRRKDTFLVNLWSEADEQAQAQPHEWRGSVEHLSTRRRRYFTEISDLIAFLTAYAAKRAGKDDTSGT